MCLKIKLHPILLKWRTNLSKVVNAVYVLDRIELLLNRIVQI